MTPEDLLRVRQQSIMAGMGMPPPDPMDGMIPPPDMMPPQIPHGMGAPPGYPAGPTNTSPVPPAPTVDPNSAIEQLRAFQAEHAANDRLNKLLEQTPVRENPSIARKILASAMGLKGGPKAAEEIMYQPHNRAMADWTAKVGPYNQAASQERYSNANERQVLTSLAANEGNQRRYDETERHNKETENNARQLTEIRRLKDLGYTFTVTDTKIIAHRPDGTVYDTGLDPGKFSPFALEELKQKGRMAAIDNRGEEARATKAAPGDESPQSPKEAMDQEKISRKRLWETDPNARKFLVTNTNGSFDLVDEAEVDEDDLPAFYRFRQKLYPGMPAPTPPAAAASNGGSGGGAAPKSSSVTEYPRGPLTPAEMNAKIANDKKAPSGGASSQVADDEVIIEDIRTGNRFAMKRENVARALAIKPPRYRVVK